MKCMGAVLPVLMLFMIVGNGGEAMENPESDLAGLLPDILEGWDVVEEDQVYDRDNLYEYINGGAELYLSYSFRKVINRIYTAPEQPEILVDIFLYSFACFKANFLIVTKSLEENSPPGYLTIIMRSSSSRTSKSQSGSFFQGKSMKLFLE